MDRDLLIYGENNEKQLFSKATSHRFIVIHRMQLGIGVVIKQFKNGLAYVILYLGKGY